MWTIQELNVAKSGIHPGYHYKKPYKSMVFGDVLYDGHYISLLNIAPSTLGAHVNTTVLL